MNYYPFHIGDYASHTRHLTLMEDLAYRRLLDLYYLHERPLNARSTPVEFLLSALLAADAFPALDAVSSCCL